MKTCTPAAMLYYVKELVIPIPDTQVFLPIISPISNDTNISKDTNYIDGKNQIIMIIMMMILIIIIIVIIITIIIIIIIIIMIIMITILIIIIIIIIII